MMRKFGTVEVLAAAQGRIPEAAVGQKTGHRAVFQYVPKPGYLYVRSRAISSRCNDNFDMFPAEEIKQAYKTFIGKPVFVNHVNDDHRAARGVIIDAALHEDRNPDGSPDTWTEVLMEVDGSSFPKLAEAILSGDIDRTSMGCDVKISKCSYCGNEATSPLEYCSHIPGKKGQRIYRTLPDGRREGVLVFEICSGLSFFENSLLVEPPADPTAFFLGKVDVGPGLEHLVAKAQRKVARIEEALIESGQMRPAVPAQRRTASRKTAGFLDSYPSDEEVDRRREGGFTGGEPWLPYRHQLESRPEPRTVESFPHIKPGTSSREHGTTYVPAQPGERGAFVASSPQEEYHGPYEVVRHARTGRYHVVDNQERPTRYGGEGGMADRHEAEFMRDYADHRQGAKEKARGLADRLLNGMHEILDPGGTEESREAERRTEGMNRLLNLGYHPKDIQAEREDYEPYAEVHHPSGWFARDHGGDNIDIGHVATGDEAHDMFNVRAQDNTASPFQSNRRPGYGPVEVAQELHHWVTGPEEETGGYAKYLEAHDPRIRRWKSRHTGARMSIEQYTRQVFARVAQALQTQAAAQSDEWFAENPPSAHHIVEKFLHAHRNDPDAFDAGMNWYSDAHHIAKALGKGDTAKAAGLMGVYSAGTPVAPNYHYASRALLHNAPVGGKKDVNLSEIPEESRDFHGMPNASATQRDQARRMLNGEHHSTVLTSPKVSNYAHLIEHGDDYDDGPERVVVDRHAISAAVGRRITEGEFGKLRLASNDNGKKSRATGEVQDYGNDMNSRYKRVADAYRDATDQLRAMGFHVKAHQVQAVAWTVQKQRNDAEDEAHVAANGPQAGHIKGRQLSQERARDAWEGHYEGEHGSAYMPQYPRHHWGRKQLVTIAGRRYEIRYRQQRLSYGETKSPQDVDTLRDERCAICGNDTAYDGRECQVCGYLAPPKALGDPDVDKAKQLDSLKQSISDDLDEADPSRKGADFDAGDLDALQATGDDPGSSWLECDNCGTGLRPAVPSTEDDEPGVEQSGPAAGDPCPVCQKGLLQDTGVSENDTDEEAEEAEEDDQDEDTPATSDKDLPATKNSATAKYRHPLKERQMMNQALAALGELQSLVEYQQRENNKLQQRLAVKDSQIQRLTAGLQAIASHLGPEVDTLVRKAVLRKQADEQNPAQPIPEPAPEPPVQGTVDTKTPEAFADVRIPGMVPGSNNDVAADAVTTAYTPGQDLPSPAVKNLVDVTRPIDGTQGPRPLSETKTNVDVRVGNPMNPQTAFPLSGDFNQAQRTGSLDLDSDGQLRFMASMRLARLQLAHGLESGDDLSLAQRIASSDKAVAQINHEIELLNKLATVANRRQQQQVAPPRAAVPRPAVQRTVPALTGDALQATASMSGDDSDLALVFVGLG